MVARGRAEIPWGTPAVLEVDTVLQGREDMQLVSWESSDRRLVFLPLDRRLVALPLDRRLVVLPLDRRLVVQPLGNQAALLHIPGSPAGSSAGKPW